MHARAASPRCVGVASSDSFEQRRKKNDRIRAGTRASKQRAQTPATKSMILALGWQHQGAEESEWSCALAQQGGNLLHPIGWAFDAVRSGGFVVVLVVVV
mmetsp:Transcript_8786/g.18374  ORF Transcript_8786/g.18374 Transcript_8786/m.18374 type:complete len:100 (-) Transcript_8786:139-438(-)